jgi:hypothetical protein
VYLMAVPSSTKAPEMKRSSCQEGPFAVAMARGALVAAALLAALACGSSKKSDPLEETLLAELQARTHGMEGTRFTIATPANFAVERATNHYGMPLVRFSHPGADAQRVPSFVLEMQLKEGQFPASAYMVEKQYGPEEAGASVEALEPLGDTRSGWLMVTRKPGPEGFVRVRSFWDTNSRFALHCLSEHTGEIDPRALDLMKRVCGSLTVQHQASAEPGR